MKASVRKRFYGVRRWIKEHRIDSNRWERPVWQRTPSGRGPHRACAKLRRGSPGSTSTLFHVQPSSLAAPSAAMVDIRRSSRLNPSARSRSPSPPSAS